MSDTKRFTIATDKGRLHFEVVGTSESGTNEGDADGMRLLATVIADRLQPTEETP